MVKLSTVERKRLVFIHIKKGMTYDEAVRHVKKLEKTLTKTHKKMRTKEKEQQSKEKYKKGMEALYKR